MIGGYTIDNDCDGSQTCIDGFYYNDYITAYSLDHYQGKETNEKELNT